jgi:CBS domain-containing protein
MSLLDERKPARIGRPRLRIGDLVKAVPTLHTTDSLSKALRLFSTAGLPALPVVEGETLVGLVTERDIVDWLAAAQGELGWTSPEACHDAMVMQHMRAELTVGLAEDGLDEVLSLFERDDFKLLPVIDAERRYQGVLIRATVLAALTHSLRPDNVGGMATPLGVFLTTGHVSAGAGFWGLFLTGAALTVTNAAIALGFYAAERSWGFSLPAPFEALAGLLLLLTAVRFSPLAGFHAAEHQTVNAIERGEPLEAEAVRAMPREHPRCGTNLMALLFGAQLLIPLLAQDPLWLLPSALLLYLGWRKVGGWLQRVFTTKPPRAYQLASGLRAGQDLLDAYAQRPAYRVGRWRRLWNMGLLQVLAGGLTTMAALEGAFRLIP